MRMRFIKEQARFANLEMIVQAPQGEQYDNYESPAPAAAASAVSPLQNMTGADEFAITPAAAPRMAIAPVDEEAPF